MPNRAKSRLAALVDLEALEALLKRFNRLTGLVIAITDCEGNVLVSAGKRKICIGFHRACEETAARCDANEAYIREHLRKGEHLTKACGNGLTDAAYPITIDGEHVATVRSGQFLMKKPDLTFFKKQAGRNGFDEKAYLDALAEVPVYSKAQINDIMGYYAQFAEMLAQIGIQAKNTKLLNRELSAAHDALVRNESRLRLALRVARMGTWERDVKDEKIVTDQAWQAYLGYGPEEITTDEAYFDIIHPEDREKVQKHSTILASQSHGMHEEEFRIRTAHGQWRWVLSTGQAITRDKKGNPRRIIGVMQDVTERHDTEERLRAQREALAHVTRVSTMGELAASLAHEINQPLTAIMSNAQAGTRFLSMQAPDLKEVEDVLLDITEDAHRAGEVIRRLRSLLSKKEVEPEPVDINKLIADTCQLLNGEIVKRKVNVSLELKPDIQNAKADPVQVQQVLVNLILNACEAMTEQPGARLLAISTRPVDNLVMVSVADTGQGLPVEDEKKVFELFFTTKNSGMGTGLAISTSIAEAHGGTLTARNRDNGGAEFRFTIPVYA